MQTGVTGRREPAVAAEDLASNDSCNRKAVEAVGERLPEFDAVPTLALVVKAVDSVDGSALVVASKKEHVARVLHFVGEQQAHCLERLLATVDIVSQEKESGRIRRPCLLEYSEQVKVLQRRPPEFNIGMKTANRARREMKKEIEKREREERERRARERKRDVPRRRKMCAEGVHIRKRRGRSTLELVSQVHILPKEKKKNYLRKFHPHGYGCLSNKNEEKNATTKEGIVWSSLTDRAQAFNVIYITPMKGASSARTTTAVLLKKAVDPRNALRTSDKKTNLAVDIPKNLTRGFDIQQDGFFEHHLPASRERCTRIQMFKKRIFLEKRISTFAQIRRE
jgi:hypothetical protein